MRILHVVPTYLPATRYGGPIHSVHGLCVALARLGHEVDVVTTSVDGPHDSDVAHGVAVDLDGVNVWYFRSRVLRRLYYSPSMARALHALVPRADVVHLHSVFLWPTSATARVAAHHGVPYIVSPRGMLVRELIDDKSTALKTGWLTLIESTTLAGAAAVHMTSRREFEDARRLALPLPNPLVVPNGVEPGPPPPLNECLQRAEPYALYLGRLNWKKNLDLAIRAVAGTAIKLVICGNDEEGHTATLQRIAHEARAESHVEFRSAVSGTDKQRLLAGAAFVVLPSRNENFGNVVVEAMAVGTAVVISDRVGAADLVRRADAGVVCAASVDALRSAMLDLWSDTTRCATLGANGARFAAHELSWDRVGQQMAAHYATLRQASAERGAA